MKSKYIVMPVLLFVLVFGSTSQTFAQVTTTGTRQESTLEKIKDILSSIQSIFSDTLAQVTGSYATVGAATAERFVTADFGKVTYYPNLKSKIGMASNIKVGAPLETAVDLVKPIGPGAICNNIEFDQWLKWQSAHPNGLLYTVATSTSDTDNPALIEVLSDPSNPGSRPIRTSDVPAPWLRQYEQKVGASDMALVLQLTGPAPQFQVASSTYSDLARHPAPTDIAASANYTARFASVNNHAYPIWWSFWNEPGHTLMSVARGRDATGAAIPGCALDAKGKVVDFSCEPVPAFRLRWQQERDKSVLVASNMYTRYNQSLRPVIGTYSRFGGASFLSSDFNPLKLSLSEGLLDGDTVYFKEFITAQSKLPDPKPIINFFSFNSFNGRFNATLLGARTVLGTLSSDSLVERAPFIFTQYAPRSMKISDDNKYIDESSAKTPIMRVVTDELTDMVTFQESTDVQFACRSYWVGGKTGIFQQSTKDLTNLVPTARYSALKLFAELPVMRAPLTLNGIRTGSGGVMGLAGINHTTAAVLLWNNATATTSVLPLQMSNVPASIASSGVTTLQVLDGTSATPRNVAYKIGDFITLPPNSVALIKTQVVSAPDPLVRRKALGNARFLKNRIYTDRVSVPCTPEESVPGVVGCSRNTGSFGYYDAVRGVAYLGTATTTGARDPKVLAVYENLSPKLYVNLNTYSGDISSASYGEGAVSVELRFPTCPAQPPVVLSTKTDTLFRRGGGVVDLVAAKVPVSCYQQKPAEILFKTAGLQPGAQVEMYISNTKQEFDQIRQYTNKMRNTLETSTTSQL